MYICIFHYEYMPNKKNICNISSLDVLPPCSATLPAPQISSLNVLPPCSATLPAPQIIGFGIGLPFQVFSRQWVSQYIYIYIVIITIVYVVYASIRWSMQSS